MHSGRSKSRREFAMALPGFSQPPRYILLSQVKLRQKGLIGLRFLVGVQILPLEVFNQRQLGSTQVVRF